MSLKKKIVLGFLIVAVIIAVLAAFEYVNFVKIKREIAYLEITDTIRSKSLQLRRHEKNYFLHGDPAERQQVHDYLKQLNDIITGSRAFDSGGMLEGLSSSIEDYGRIFGRIEALAGVFHTEFSRVKPMHRQHSRFFPLIESTILERPLLNEEVLRSVFLLRPDNPAVHSLRALDASILALRRSGEAILVKSKELDAAARDNVDGFIRRSQLAILVVFPLFIIVGFGSFLFIIGGVVRRLHSLTELVERTGGGEFRPMEVDEGWVDGDEVGVLIRTMNAMEVKLEQREKELLQSKKLAAIGTLASGVAHELNNPLSNIYTTAQRLSRKTGEECPPAVRKGLEDIFSQTMRVKGIVGDLLEFARGRELQMREVDLEALVKSSFRHMVRAAGAEKILLETDIPGALSVSVDPEQMERVFINLFTNAVQAMGGEGKLSVVARAEKDRIRVSVTDTGPGIPEEMQEKIFEPFFTSKERGTGLGLAIVFNIVQRHGGTLTVRSIRGEGATFIMTLPGAPRG